MTKTEAFRAGFNAALAKQSWKTNPFSASSVLGCEWSNGHQHGTDAIAHKWDADLIHHFLSQDWDKKAA